MKPCRRLSTALAVGSVLFAAALAMGQATTRPAEPTGREPTTQPGERLAEYLRIIRRAGNPLVAAAAYGRGYLLAPDSAALRQAYVQQMVHLRAPELAYQPAAELVKLDPKDGLAWALMAQMQAKVGEYVGALQDIVKAVQNAPEDRYVQARAGELLAWYDHQTSLPDVPGSLKKALSDVRPELNTRPTFVSSYQELKEVLAGGVGPPPAAEAWQAKPATPEEQIARLQAEVDRLRQTLQAVQATAAPQSTRVPERAGNAGYLYSNSWSAYPSAPPPPRSPPMQSYPGTPSVPSNPYYPGAVPDILRYSLYPYGFYGRERDIYGYPGYEYLFPGSGLTILPGRGGGGQQRR